LAERKHFTIEIDVGTLRTGTYTTNLVIISNDPDESLLSINVTLVTTGADHADQ
jgi:hypothetical protein